MYIAYMTSRDSSCINLLDLNCQWLDISKSHILVYCLFGYLSYKCRSVVLDTAGLLYLILQSFLECCISLLGGGVPWYITV